MANYLLVGLGELVIPPVAALKRAFIATASNRLMTGSAEGSWAQVSSLTVAMLDTIQSVASVPASPNTLIVAGLLATVPKIYRTADGGITWTNVTPSFGNGQLFRNSTHVFAFRPDADGLIWRSADGISWTNMVGVPAGFGGGWGASASDAEYYYTAIASDSAFDVMRYAPIAGDPSGLGTLVAFPPSQLQQPLSHTWPSATNQGFFYTPGAGVTPKLVTAGVKQDVFNTGELIGGICSNGTVTVAISNDTLRRSLDLGLTYTTVHSDANLMGAVTNTQGQKFAIDPNNPAVWYCIGGDGQGSGVTRYVWVSQDTGLTWTAQTLHALGGGVFDVDVLF